MKLLPDNSVYGSSADKNQRNCKKEVNDNTVLERGSKRKGTYIYMKSYLPCKVNFKCSLQTQLLYHKGVW